MTTDATDTGPDPDMTAAELALGLLDGDDRAAALRRMLAEPAFAREVDGWRDRLAGLFDDYRPVAAPEGLIDRLGGGEGPRASARARWPVLALAAALAATIALFFVTWRTPLPVPPPPASHAMMLATLVPVDKGTAPIGTAIDMDAGEIRVTATAIAPAGKTAQLWMIKDGVPHSMGLLHRGAPTRMPLAERDRAALAAGMTLAVSIEPAGGSPGPVPTGPVVASGALSAA